MSGLHRRGGEGAGRLEGKCPFPNYYSCEKGELRSLLSLNQVRRRGPGGGSAVAHQASNERMCGETGFGSVGTQKGRRAAEVLVGRPPEGKNWTRGRDPFVLENRERGEGYIPLKRGEELS